MLNTLSRNNILTGLIWDLPIHDNMAPGYLKWMANIRRSHRRYIYSVQGDAEVSELIGYSERTSPGCEPFAVHLRNLYGDGFYYFSAGKGQIYLLMIMDGIIISGSDCVITENSFQEMVASLPESKYARLQVTEISLAQLDTIAESCKSNQKIFKKKQRMFWSAVGFGIFLLLIASSVFLYTIISG
ncbi:pilus assembly protein [Rahnella perminowiae]|uniref:pilus assembly protein n=1 Tax=Rahnella perminowiae TaxID=2816244 RepID=UPI001C258E6F|nr:pilus assembly protein [Rahnella perminowiae]MBU9823583.1 pilus assembly protein [Rahnella perminowiae]